MFLFACSRQEARLWLQTAVKALTEMCSANVLSTCLKNAFKTQIISAYPTWPIRPNLENPKRNVLFTLPAAIVED